MLHLFNISVPITFGNNTSLNFLYPYSLLIHPLSIAACIILLPYVYFFLILLNSVSTSSLLVIFQRNNIQMATFSFFSSIFFIFFLSFHSPDYFKMALYSDSSNGYFLSDNVFYKLFKAR